MKVLVLGAGVIGVTTAYWLAEAGHDVTVVDRQPGPALETSFANAGQVSPGYASPWAAPGVPLKALKWMVRRDPPLIIRPGFDPQMWSWLLAMLGNCTAPRYAANKQRMLRLAEYSRLCLNEITARLGLAFDQRQLGTLQLFRTGQALDAAGRDIAVLDELGVPYEVLDRAGCIAAEPGLASARATIAGGLRLPNDQTGDCYRFTAALERRATGLGAAFRYGETIERIEASGGRVASVRTSRGTLTADHYVLALGSFSARAGTDLGIDMPVYPVKGYSLTLPVTNDDAAPRSTVLDDTYKVAVTRLGNRVRVGGMAELSGYRKTLLPARRQTLMKVVQDLFPSSTGADDASFWTGLRPMTPDAIPIVGPTRLANLSLNTGHGTLGWTMACGSAALIADIITGTIPAIDTSGFSLTRFAGRQQ
jgi:D-amino-acid dehydrogenase